MFMKILWVTHRGPFHPRSGGAERAISEISSRLASMNHDVTILSAKWEGSNGSDNMGRVKIRRFGNNVFLHLYLPIFLMKNKIEVVINDLGHAVPWPSTTILKKKSIILFYHLHARSLPGQVNKILVLAITAIEKCYFLIYPSRIFVTESITSKDDLRMLGIEESNIVLIQLGVDLDLYHISEKSNFPTVLYFGGYRKYKRPIEAVSIFKKISVLIPNTKFTFIGDGPELQNVKSEVKNQGIDDKTTFTGRLDDEALAEIVSQSWLNIHTSVTEGWGLSIIEASASGTPTVAYSVPGVVDAIEDGRNGLKVKDGDMNAFVNAALKILRDPIPWQMSSRKVAEKYSWDNTAKKWDEMIRRTVGGE